jgi:hypothetical protein
MITGLKLTKPNWHTPMERERRIFLRVLCIIGLMIAPRYVHAQRGEPKVVTMQSGAQYEGIVGSIAEMYSGEPVPDPFDSKPIVVINDGLRRVFVRDTRVQGGLGDSNRNEVQLDVFQRVSNSSVGFGGSILRIGPFDKNGHRLLTLRDPRGRIQTIVQGITSVTPRLCEVKTLVGTSRQWSMRIGVGTVPTSILLPLLRRQIKDPNDLTSQQKIADFLIQAGYYQLASDELRSIQQRFPENERLKKDIERTRRLLKQQAARQVLSEARLRLSSGQNELSQKFLASAINVEGVAGEILAEFRELQNQSKIENQKTEETRQKFQTLIESVSNLSAKQANTVQRLNDELKQDLNPVNAARLGAWLRLAEDANTRPQQKIALAISGWLLGSNRAIDNLAVAESMFDVRDLIFKYLNTKPDQKNRREEILKQLEQFESGTPGFLAAMIAQMNPPSPPVDALSGTEPIPIKVTLPGTKPDAEPVEVECLGLVPPEYDPYRRYPLLLTLPDRKNPANELTAWCGRYNPKLKVRTGQAMRHGYIVVVVPWQEQEGQLTNKCSGYEHAVVLKALRAAMRTFSVDSDRVYLAGRGIGGNVAYDVGLSHPEHWAGVVGISGELDRYMKIYASNRHVPLPVYSVVGDKNAQAIANSKFVWNTWFRSRNYVNNTVVQYIGRANDAIYEAIPAVFDWAKLHRRRWPGGAGFEFVCKTVRPWDNYFWFLEAGEIPEANIVWPEMYRSNKLRAFKLEGSVSPGRTNQFQLSPARPPGTTTLWLGSDYVDFSKQIEIKGMGRDFRGFASPSRRTLLEDVRKRADRQRPYLAKIICDGGVWEVKE